MRRAAFPGRSHVILTVTKIHRDFGVHAGAHRKQAAAKYRVEFWEDIGKQSEFDGSKDREMATANHSELEPGGDRVTQRDRVLRIVHFGQS